MKLEGSITHGVDLAMENRGEADVTQRLSGGIELSVGGGLCHGEGFEMSLQLGPVGSWVDLTGYATKEEVAAGDTALAGQMSELETSLNDKVSELETTLDDKFSDLETALDDKVDRREYATEEAMLADTGQRDGTEGVLVPQKVHLSELSDGERALDIRIDTGVAVPDSGRYTAKTNLSLSENCYLYKDYSGTTLALYLDSVKVAQYNWADGKWYDGNGAQELGDDEPLGGGVVTLSVDSGLDGLVDFLTCRKPQIPHVSVGGEWKELATRDDIERVDVVMRFATEAEMLASDAAEGTIALVGGWRYEPVENVAAGTLVYGVKADTSLTPPKWQPEEGENDWWYFTEGGNFAPARMSVLFGDENCSLVAAVFPTDQYNYNYGKWTLSGTEAVFPAKDDGTVQYSKMMELDADKLALMAGWVTLLVKGSVSAWTRQRGQWLPIRHELTQADVDEICVWPDNGQ